MAQLSERPLRRTAIKLLASLFLGKANAHAQNWWPGLALKVPKVPMESGQVLYRGERVAQLLHASALKADSGPQIFIIGSGPSVTENDISAIDSKTAILLNGAISLLGKEVQEALAVAIEDERFVWRHFDLMRSKIAAGTLCLLSVGVLRAICETDRHWLSDKRIILIDDIRKPYRAARRTASTLGGFDFVRLSEDKAAGFSEEPASGVFQGGSIVISALQFAIYCSPARIGLFGIDISNAASPRFYEKVGSMAKSGVAGAAPRILAHIAEAKQVCDERGIELLNFSKNSALRDCGIEYDSRYAKLRGSSAQALSDNRSS